MSLLLFIIWIVGSAYLFLIFIFYRNLSTKNDPATSELKNNKTVSVIIPFRNEEENLNKLLESLKNQSFPKNKTTFLFINDHSEDNSKEIIENFAFQNGNLNIELLELDEGIRGKKAALRKAYNYSDSEIIISTDADCKLHPDWISLSVNTFEKEEIQMLCGGVKIDSGANWMKQFQSVELMSLIGSGAASIKMGNPILSNGANLSFRRSILNKIDYSKLQPNSASGDDVFLMMEIFRVFGPKAFRFETHPNHWVNTQAMATFEDLVQQRIRWTSKSKNYKNPFQIFVSLVVFLSNLAIPILFLWGMFSFKFTIAFIIYWLLKSIVDYLFLNKVAKISEQEFNLQKYMNTAIIYPFFISYIGIIGQFTDFKWKGRNYQNK